MLWMIFPAIAVLLLSLVLSAKVGVRVIFGEQFAAWCKVGPVMLQVYPYHKKDEKRGKKGGKKSKEKEKPPRNITFDAVRRFIDALLPPVLDMMGRVRRGMQVKTLTLHLVISDRDPAVAARRYGNLNAVIWPLLAVVESLVSVQRRDVEMTLDFAAHQSSARGEVFVTLRVCRGIMIFLADGVPVIQAVLRFLKETKPVEQKKPQAEKEKDAAA